MITVNLREAKQIIKGLYKVGRPVILMGSPGIGKTAIFRQAAKELNIGNRTREASSLDPTDVCGVCYVTDGESRYGRPVLMPKPEDGAEGMLVVDELASCPPAVQVALYALFLEKRLGDYPLPNGWVPMGTGNYTTDGAFAYNISTALSDRGYMINVNPDFQIWKEDFAYPNEIDEDIISFFNYRPDLFYTFDNRDKQVKGKGFSSCRGHELASDAKKSGLTGHALLAALSGCESEGVATEMIAFWRVKNEMPDIEEIYRGKISKIPTEPSILYAMSGALIGFLKTLPKGISMDVAIKRLLEYSMTMPDLFAVLTIRDAAIRYRKHITGAGDAWARWATKYRDVVI